MTPLMILGQPELLIILFIILILFGSSKLPELARSMGKAKSEYKKGATEGEEEIKEMEAQTQATEQAPAAPEAPATPTAPAPETPTEEPKQE
ncbi:MAG: twin-arginine translocase TatA/TatE family subunit [Candidatus Hydrothermarchaeales archaeon]